MKVCFVVRSVTFQRSTYTTTHLAFEAWKRDHTVAYATINDITCSDPQEIRAYVTSPGEGPFLSREEFLEALKRNQTSKIEVCLNDFDVVFLRYNALDLEFEHEKCAHPVIQFGRLLKMQDVFVVNDPNGLARASSKMYLMSLPESIRAETLITRNPRKVKEFVKRFRRPAIIKPLDSFGGRDVFFIKNSRDININQIIATVRKSGYLMVQEYLPAVKRGDKRLLLLNGSPIFLGDRAAIYKRISPPGEIRSNMHIGGKRKRAEFTPTEADIVDRIRPKLVADGLYFVGADIVGDKLLEVNAFCPGGIHNINELYQVNVGEAVIRDLEKRVQVSKLRNGRAHLVSSTLSI